MRRPVANLVPSKSLVVTASGNRCQPISGIIRIRRSQVRIKLIGDLRNSVHMVVFKRNLMRARTGKLLNAPIRIKRHHAWKALPKRQPYNRSVPGWYRKESASVMIFGLTVTV